jgi:hypothetical protein
MIIKLGNIGGLCQRRRAPKSGRPKISEGPDRSGPSIILVLHVAYTICAAWPNMVMAKGMNIAVAAIRQ